MPPPTHTMHICCMDWCRFFIQVSSRASSMSLSTVWQLRPLTSPPLHALVPRCCMLLAMAMYRHNSHHMAMHTIISHNYLFMIYKCYVALTFFWICENEAKWNIMKLIAKNRSYKIELEYLAVYDHASMAAFRQLSTHIVPPRSNVWEARLNTHGQKFDPESY